jgi:UDP:flavonoid glycosyltransferase YjiC (YdhE family)
MAGSWSLSRIYDSPIIEDRLASSQALIPNDKEWNIMGRIVLTTLGSLGDLHPYIAIALGLKARGHEAVLATGECYRQKVEALGLGFRPVRPDCDVVTDPVVMRRFMNFRWGTIRVLREFFLPAVRETYEDTLAAVDGGADLLLSHPITWTTRLVAEKTGIPWASTQITPLCLFSAHDPSSLPGIPDLSTRLHSLGPTFWGLLGRSFKWATRSWAKPIYRLRSEIGLPPAGDNPLVDGHSSLMVLALFSKLLADHQPDWPPQTIHTGFPVYDQDGTAGLPPELARFLNDGPAPIVFTLGVSAAAVAGAFFEQSIAAAKRLGRRAVLIVGKGNCSLPAYRPDGVVAFDYAPYSELFPKAAVVVHAGGIGTSGLALRSGRPMLVVPYAHDQPDNAARLTRLGVARTIAGHRTTSARLVTELGRLLEDPAFARRALEVGAQIRQEDGARAACDALETLFSASAGNCL